VERWSIIDKAFIIPSIEIYLYDLRIMYALKKSYDRIDGEYYARSRLFGWWHKNRFRRAYDIIDISEKGFIIVDVGCNGGNFTESLLDFGDVVGLDVSRSFIQASKRRVKGASFVLTDVQYLPLREGVCDLVTCLEVLEHLPNPDRVIRGSWRILRNDGRLFISTPDDGKVLWRFIWFFWQNIGRGTAWKHKHIYKFNREKLVGSIYPYFTDVTVDYVNFFMLIMLICRKRD
jgi:2-polyprenyl-3-methyl-5-hydroxy-6-metoxy-1,4-benzoquinol methylase